MGDRKSHWQAVHAARAPEECSWFQAEPAVSLALVREAGVPADAPVVDVGAGASTLVDRLLDEGFSRVAVLDVSGAALERARARLGARGAVVDWIEADVTSWRPARRYALWHDRAAFHFLTTDADRAAYAAAAAAAVAPGGWLLLAGFAPEGPEKCSGLPVRRLDAALVEADFGAAFEPRAERAEAHRTPWGTEQLFRWFALRRR